MNSLSWLEEILTKMNSLSWLEKILTRMNSLSWLEKNTDKELEKFEDAN